MSHSPPIIYTWTDEAPSLATHVFLPVVRAFAGATGVPVETRDISLARRILALFTDVLDDGQSVSDDLAELGLPPHLARSSNGRARLATGWLLATAEFQRR